MPVYNKGLVSTCSWKLEYTIQPHKDESEVSEDKVNWYLPPSDWVIRVSSSGQGRDSWIISRLAALEEHRFPTLAVKCHPYFNLYELELTVNSNWLNGIYHSDIIVTSYCKETLKTKLVLKRTLHNIVVHNKTTMDKLQVEDNMAICADILNNVMAGDPHPLDKHCTLLMHLVYIEKLVLLPSLLPLKKKVLLYCFFFFFVKTTWQPLMHE